MKGQKHLPHFCGIFFPAIYAENKDVENHVFKILSADIILPSFPKCQNCAKLNNKILSYIRENCFDFNKVVSDKFT